jgi:hypothetical protein
MMKAMIKRVGIVLASLVGNPPDLERGEYLVKSVSACMDCHGENLQGKPFLDEQPIGYISAPNLTRGAGGVGEWYTLEDWARAIRHGVGGDGRVMGGMPSDSYAHLSDEDLAVPANLARFPIGTAMGSFRNRLVGYGKSHRAGLERQYKR